MLRFASPLMLSLLLPACVAAIYFARRRRRGDSRLTLPLAGMHVGIVVSPWVRIDRMLPWMRGLAMLLIVFSLARPQAGSTLQTTSTHGVDIVVALDVSGSMRAEDFKPDNRLEVARQTVQQFVAGRPSDRLGLVIFASLATTRCPLTLDHAMLDDFLTQIDFAPPEEDGTALGMGLATAVNRLRDSDARSRVVVLVTDGENNAGQIGPDAAAEAARALDVKVYTIGVGSDGEVPFPINQGPFGVRYVMQEVTLDEELLREIADLTGGQYFRATDAEALRATFETIDALEKTEIESRVRVLYRELFHWMLFPAVGLLFLERFLLATRLRRIP